MARHRQHRADRGPQPHPHGRQRAERPVRQVPAGPAEVPQQGVASVHLIHTDDEASARNLCVCLYALQCFYADDAQDPESTVEGAV